MSSSKKGVTMSKRYMYRVYSLNRKGRKLYQYTIATHDPATAFDNTVRMSVANPSLSFVIERVAA